MLIKRTHLFLEILLGIFIAYLLLMRLAIVGLQSYPQQSVQFLNDFTAWQFNVGDIQLEQTWLGAEFSITDLQIENHSIEFAAQNLSGDINIFAPMIPLLSFGENLNLQQVSLRFNNPSSESQAFQDLPGLAQLNASYRQIVDFLRSQDFTQRSWHKITVNDLVMNDVLGAQTAVQVDNLDLIKASQINLVAEFGVYYSDVLDFERFNLKLNFSTNSWGGLDFGALNLTSYQPMQMQRLAKLLPEKWGEILPAGEVLLDWSTSFQDAQLEQSVAKINAQALDWRDDYDVLPQSIGLELRWNPRLDVNLEDSIANFELVNVQLDNNFVETLSPVQLRLHKEQELELLADRFDIAPFKEMLRVFVDSDYLAELLNKAVELDVSDFAMRLNWQTLQLPSLRTRFGRLGIPLTDYPGVATQNLALVKQGDLLLVEADEPVWVLEPRVHPLPVKVVLPPTVVLNYADNNLSIDPMDFTLDRFAVSLEAFDWLDQKLVAQASISAPDVKTVLGYLPYGLFGEDLNRWLVASNLSGKKPAFMLNYKGDLSQSVSASVEPVDKGAWLKGLQLQGQIQQASFKFDSKWPQIAPSDIDFDFKNNELSFSSRALRLDGVDQAAKATVKISDLTKKDIALRVKASTTASLQQAVSYLAKTPLPEQVGLADYVQKSEPFSGQAQVDIADLWVPISGYDGKDEKVKGSVQLKESALNLDSLPEISAITGMLDFTEESLTAKNVQMRLFDHSARLDISTDIAEKLLNIDIAGKERAISGDYFAEALPYQLTIAMPTGKEESTIRFTGSAQLQYAQSTLPYPFTSLQLDSPVRFSGVIDKVVSVELQQSNQIRAHLVYDPERADFRKIQGYIGSAASAKLPFKESDSFIRGDIDKLDVGQWIKWWQGLSSSQAQSPLRNVKWRGSQLDVAELRYKSQIINAAAIKLSSLDKGIKLDIDSEKLLATAFVPDEGAIDVQIDRVQLQSEKSAEVHDQLMCAVHKNQNKYPEIKVLARNVQFDQYPFEQVRFSLKPNDYGYSTDDVYAQFKQGAGLITAKYRYDQNRNLSAAEFDVSSKKLERLLKYLDISKGVTSKQADIHTEIAWFGGFECFSLNGLFGQLNFKLDEGVVEDVEPGVARLLGLLSVDSLARRLQLKLDDVTNEGLIYDDIVGKAILNNNKLQLVSLKLDAPAVKVDMKGLIDMQKEAFDLKADVTPAVGSSLPTIAALAGVANPLAALAVYTLMKVIPDINENIITYQYQINGPWKDPKIELVPQTVE